MRGHHLAGRVYFFSVAGGVRGNLCGLFAGAAGAFQVLTNLLAARTRCVEILLRVALDLRRAAAASGDFVAERAKPVGQLGLIDGGGELLRREETLRLNGARLAVVALGHIEDDGVGVKLRRNVTIDRAGGVMLELRRNELACRLRLDGCRRCAPACSVRAAQVRPARCPDGPAGRGRRHPRER